MRKFLFTSFAITLLGCSVSTSALASMPDEHKQELWASHSYHQTNEGYENQCCTIYMRPTEESVLKHSNIFAGFKHPKVVSIQPYGQSQGVRINGGQVFTPLVIRLSPKYDCHLPEPIKAKISQMPRENVEVVMSFTNYPVTEKAVVGIRPHYAVFQNDVPKSGVYEQHQEVEVGVFDMPEGCKLLNTTNHDPFTRTRITIRGDEFEVKPTTDDPLRLVNPGPNMSLCSYVGLKNELGQKAFITHHFILDDHQMDDFRRLTRMTQEAGEYSDYYPEFFNSTQLSSNAQRALNHIITFKDEFYRHLSVLAEEKSFRDTALFRKLISVFGLMQPVATLDQPLEFDFAREENEYDNTQHLTSKTPLKAIKDRFPGANLLCFVNAKLADNSKCYVDGRTDATRYGRHDYEFVANEARTIDFIIPEHVNDDEKLVFSRREPYVPQAFGLTFDRVEVIFPLHHSKDELFRFGLNGDASVNGNAGSLPDFVQMTGFSGKENLHQWTDGHQASITFPNLVQKENFVNKITFKVNPWLADDDAFQFVTVSLNGLKYGEYIFAPGQIPEISVQLPYRLNDAVIVFDLPDAKSPGVGDGRLLGLSFVNATLTFLSPLQKEKQDGGHF
jgi:hypothetical protein